MRCAIEEVGKETRQKSALVSSAERENECRDDEVRGTIHKGYVKKYVLVLLAMTLCVGCGKYKEELEYTKLQVDKLTSENKKMAETTAALEREKLGLSDELRLLTSKTEALQKELASLNRAKVVADDENAQLKKKIEELQSEMNLLKTQKADVERVSDEQKRRTGVVEQPGPSRGRDRKGPDVIASAGGEEKKPGQNFTPCEAVIAYMKRSEGIIRNHKGEQRRKMLEQAKRELSGAMKGAPDKAVKAANSWVNELRRGWDKPGGDIVFKLLTKRNAVLEACGKTPEEAGF
jgi:DNA repair exonuclease SbcCD ATPase subunit